MVVKKNIHSRGMTLIEMIVMIVVLSIAIPVLLRMWADVAWRSARSEVMADALVYAEVLLEEIKSKKFDENVSVPWTQSANFATADPGENKNNKDTFDDIDDYVGCTDPRVTTPAPGYIRTVTVTYVYPSGSNWLTCAQACTSETNCSQCAACCYKRVKVSVSRSDNTVRDISLETLMSAY